MNWIERSVLVASLAALASTAQAATPPISSCVMADDHPMYGDNPDQCKSNAPIRSLDRDGAPRGVTTAPTTEKQSKAGQKAGKKGGQCSERSKDQFQKDFALLERYPSEDDLQEARYRALGDEVKQVNEANLLLKELIAKARDFSEKMKFFEPPHQVPDDLRKDRDLNRELERLAFERISGAAHEILRINEKYDADLRRYRELVDGTAKKPCDPNRH